MATNSFKSIHHHNPSLLRRRHSIDYLPPSSAATAAASNKNRFFLKPITTTTSTTRPLSQPTTFAVSSASPATSTTSFDLLRQHLSSKNFREADEETRRLLIALAGESAQKRGYVFFSEVQFISEDDLKTIDGLWKQHSDNKFGYSVQKKIWKKMNKDFTRFFIKVGWMKKLESSEIEQFNYRSFPAEFIWELEEGTPEGHLPLTNALRGTQLLNRILNHPAFDGDEEEEEEGRDGEISEQREQSKVKPLGKMFKPNYTF